MAGDKDEKENLRPIIIKRIKKGGGGHHGGAWKVAYADFVTAMMAFFLLLWLLNVTTDEQKNAISNYFDPSHPKVSDSVSGAGGIMGGLSMSPVGAMVSTVQPISQPEVPDTSTRGALSGENAGKDEDTKTGPTPSEQQVEAAFRKQEDERFKKAAEALKAAMDQTPELKDLKKNLLIDITPEGLRIQIVDDKGRSMFPSGSAQMHDFMRDLLLKVSGIVVKLPNQTSVRGHTDSNKYKDPARYDNWNLSADRAQASRRVLVEGGLPEKRIENVMGRADRDHLLPKDPQNPRNRRISIILLREKVPESVKKAAQEAAAKAAAEQAAKDRAKAAAAAQNQQGGITIVDDTKSSTGTGVGKGKITQIVKTGGDGAQNEQPLQPLPVVPGGAPSAIPQQPRVIYFGGNAPDQNAPLYNAPAGSSPIETAPSTTAPKAMTFGDEPQAAPAPASAPTHEEPPAQTAPASKAVTFGDEPASAPAAAPKQAAPQDDPSHKVLEFGD